LSSSWVSLPLAWPTTTFFGVRGSMGEHDGPLLKRSGRFGRAGCSCASSRGKLTRTSSAFAPVAVVLRPMFFQIPLEREHPCRALLRSCPLSWLSRCRRGPSWPPGRIDRTGNDVPV
jgi:hypothetical protein